MVIASLFLGFFSNIDIAADFEKARKFLLETGQEVTYENINLIVEKYVNEKKENGWNRIDDILYEDRKVPAIENVGYTAHTFYFASIAVADEFSEGMYVVFFFLLVFALSGIFMLIAYPLFSAKILSEEIEEARKFLDNAGREETKENVNLVLNFFYSNHKWQEIEDMPYNLFEDIEIVSGNMRRKKRFL